MELSRRSFIRTAAGVAGVAALTGLTGCGEQDAKEDKKLYVYNAGEYIAEDVVGLFEEETGISVVYDTFETPEAMYAILEKGQNVYDVICPSDYMIQKMIAKGMLQPIDFDNVPNADQIDPAYMEKSRAFDPDNQYSIPYTWGTLGILYNTTMVDEAPTSWDVLWDEKYKDQILMQDSVRDAFCVALKRLGYSANTEDQVEIDEAKQSLIDQKPLVQAYVIDQVRDKMIGGEAALGVIYSGEYLYCKDENPDLAYVIPSEGSNFWIDSWVISAKAENKVNAEAWIDFMCRPDIAFKNFDYIWYATPNLGALEQIDDEIKEDEALFPPQDVMDTCEVFSWLGEDVDKMYNDAWSEVKASE